MNNMLKFVNMNAYIQRNMGTLSLDGKTIFCVALDGTCSFDDGEEIELTESQVEDLCNQMDQ
jgi:hypothetical protein